MEHQILRAMVVLALMDVTGAARAVTFPFPMVTSVTYSGTNQYGTEKYDMTMKTIYVNDARIKEDATVNEALEILHGRPVSIPTPWGSTVMQRGNKVTSVDGWYRYNSTGSEQKFLDFMENWTALALKNVSIGPFRDSGYKSSFCVTNRVVVGNTGGGFYATDFYENSWGLDTIATCTKSQPITGYCQMKTATVNFDYGTISSNEADGAAIDQPVHVNCTTNIKYNLQVVGGPEIALDNGMAATIMTDGELAGETLNGSSGDNTVTVRSILHGKAAKTGAFAGGGIMLISYP